MFLPIMRKLLMGSSKRMEKHAPRRLGEKSRKIRESFGDSQAAFLERLGNPESILQISISSYEGGRREPPLLTLLTYAKLVNISTDDLIDDKINLPKTFSPRAKQKTAPSS